MWEWLKKTWPQKNAADSNDAADPQAARAAQLNDRQRDAIAAKQLGDDALASGRMDDAAGHYRQAIAADPTLAAAQCALGDMLREQHKLGEAAQCYRAALEHAPDLAQAHYGLGVTLLERADAQNALVCFDNAVRADPAFARAHNALGFACMELGRPAQALAAFQRTVSLEPDNGMARHLIASLNGDNPERAPVQYVEKLFDGFAETFDTHLQQLQYVTPEVLVKLLLQHAPAAPAAWHVLDLGCGTGLVGVQIARYARQLVGVDLSAKMLDKARARNLYHRLALSDLVPMMSEEPASSHDVIISADTFIYVGKLDDVFRHAARLLRAEGWFAFSVEALADGECAEPSGEARKPDYLLRPAPSCRYAHSVPYLQRMAQAHGFSMYPLDTRPIRISNGVPVQGHLVLMRKAPAAAPAAT